MSPPSGSTAGNIILVCFNSNTDTAITPPSGFTSLGSGNASSGRTEVFWKFFQTGDVIYTFTHASVRTSAIAIRISSTIGFGTNPINVFGSWSTGSTTTHTASSITTTANDTLHLFCIGRDSTNTGVYTGADFTVIQNASGGNRSAIGHRIQASAGATGSYSMTTASSMATARVMLAINEAGLTAGSGSFSLTGQDAFFPYSGDRLLDIHPNAGAAYSVCRKLRAGYSGSAIRVNRRSDNAEQDIGFDSLGDLDESALTSFIGANDAAVVAIYDQSGNGRNLIASSTASRIVVSGNIQKQDGKPCIVGNGSDFGIDMPASALINASGYFYALEVCKLSSAATIYGDGVLAFGFYAETGGSGMYLNSSAAADSFSSVNYSNRHLFESIRGATIFKIYFDGSDVTGSTSYSSAPSGTITNWRLRGGSGVTNIQEAIFWPSDQEANRSGIYTDIDGYYNAGVDYPLTADQGSFALTGQAANLKRDYRLTAESRSYAATGQAANVNYGRRLTTTVASFVQAGQDIVFTYGRRLTAAVANFAQTGQSAIIKAGRKITAAAGNVAYTGVAAGLLYGLIMPASAGAFTLSGQDAGLKRGLRMTADAGAFSLSGFQVDFREPKRITANVGTFTLTGQDAGIRYGRSITAGTGAFALNGQDAAIRAARSLAAGVGSFTLTGQDAAISRGYRLTAESAAFTLTGQDAIIRKNSLLSAGAGSFALTGQNIGFVTQGFLSAAVGSFTLTGQDTRLLYSRIFPLQSGSFSLNGQAANIGRGYTMPASGANFTLSGQVAGLEAGRFITAGIGSFALAGFPASFGTNSNLTADVGTFNFTGIATAIKAARRLTADPGVFNLTGVAANLRKGYNLRATFVSFTISGQAAGLIAARRLTADQATFALTAFAADFNQDKTLSASVGIFNVTGQDAVFRIFRLTAETGAFNLSGNAAAFDKTNRLTAGAGSFTVTGQPANLIYSNAYFVPRLLWYL